MQLQSISVSVRRTKFLFSKTRKMSELYSKFLQFRFRWNNFPDMQVDVNYIKETDNVNMPEHEGNSAVSWQFSWSRAKFVKLLPPSRISVFIAFQFQALSVMWFFYSSFQNSRRQALWCNAVTEVPNRNKPLHILMSLWSLLVICSINDCHAWFQRLIYKVKTRK